ncbi:MAG: 30S ribosomal protein S20 [Elusimicrobia bacterium]|nr:30S ribosomal protein S20 [Candidatus Obscuribacterium magneticum]
MAKKGKSQRHASALKAGRQAEKRRLLNYQVRSKVRTLTHSFLQAVTAKKAEAAKTRFIEAQSAWQKAAKSGIFSKNAAARKVSRMASRLLALTKA